MRTAFNRIGPLRWMIAPITSALTGALLAVIPVLGQPELFIIEDPGYNVSAIDVNDSGVVLVMRSLPVSPHTRSDATWFEGVLSPLAMPSRDVSATACGSVLQGEWQSLIATGIGESGTVVGYVGVAGGNCRNAGVVWHAGAAPVKVDEADRPSGQCLRTPAILSGINGSGAFVGNVCGGGGALYGSGTSFERLAPLPGYSASGPLAWDINDAGVVVGQHPWSGAQVRPVRWVGGVPEVLIDESTGALKINSTGDVLLANNKLWSSGTVRMLNPPGPVISLGTALDLNDVGSILGSIAVEVNGERWGIASLLPPDPGFTNPVANAINNRNWIVGHGMRDGVQVGFLLKPDIECFTITSQPAPASACSTAAATFTIEVAGSGQFAYRWQWMAPGINATWTDVFEGDNTDAGGQPVFVSMGAAAPSLSVQPAVDTPYTYSDFAGLSLRAVVSNVCGSETSDAATFTLCAADLGCDGAVDVFDLLDYLDLWFMADAAADLDGADGVNVFDLLVYLDQWFAGC